MDDKIKVFIIDDHPMIAQGIKTLLGHTRYEVIGFEVTGNAGVASVRRSCPDIVVTDLRLPDMLGPGVCQTIRRHLPDTKLMVLTGFEDLELLRICLDVGAEAIVLKDLKDIDLQYVFDRLLRGESFIDQRLKNKLDDGASSTSILGITARELEVLQLMSRGMTSAQIGQQLYLSVNTVRSYAQTILEKLGVRSRIEAVARAREVGVL